MNEAPNSRAAAGEPATTDDGEVAPLHRSTSSSGGSGGHLSRAGRPRRSRRRAAGAGFYAGVLDAADRLDLADAAAVRGIDQEVAVLRLRLRRLLGDHPEDFALTVRSIELLVRAVGAAGKLAADDSSDVLDRIYAELGGIVALIADAAEPPLPL